MPITTEQKHLIKLNSKERFLHPGEFYFGVRNEYIGTLLGSCIAITLWHPRYKIGGMCHFILPKQPGVHKDKVLNGKYADSALQLFEREVKKNHTALTDYQAKVFGGGNHLPHVSDKQDSIGVKNAETAMTLLMGKGVEIVVADVGEQWARRIIFELKSGDVWVKKQ